MSVPQHALIVGGTSGIGLALGQRLLSRGYVLHLVGRDLQAATRLAQDHPAQVHTYQADLSLISSLSALAGHLQKAMPAPALVVFTAGMLTARSWLTPEAQEVNYMLHHFSRQYLTQALLPAMLELPAPRIGYISSLGYASQGLNDLERFNQLGPGLRTNMRSYLPNDVFFAGLSRQHPRLSITGFQPGPTKGTALSGRASAPNFLKLIAPLFRLVAKPVDQVAALFEGHLDQSPPGFRVFDRKKSLALPEYLFEPPYQAHFTKLNAQIWAGTHPG